MVTFVFSNPRHHLDMMVPVAKVLRSRGVPCRLVSLAELRGFETPDLASQLPGVGVRRAIPRIRRTRSAGAGLGTGNSSGAGVRRVAQRLAWRFALRPRLGWLLRGSDVVVVPNDTAFPYDGLAQRLRAHRVPFALLQEGIRFPLPTETRTGAAYGAGGAAAICVWGEASARHFRSVGAAPASIQVTGNPRFDAVDPAAWQERGRALQHRLGLDKAPLLYLSNTIDDQGFCTTAEKMTLFVKFVQGAGPAVARAGRSIVVKLHARENVDAFRKAAATCSGCRVDVLDDEPLFAVLAMGHAAVVLASTVGLEALAFGLPLGVLELPGHGHVFDYVTSGAAAGLRLDDLERGVTSLLGSGSAVGASAYLENHMAHRGTAASRIADCLVDLRTS